MNRLKIVNSSVAVLLIVAVVAVIATLRNSPQPVPPPDVPVAVPVAEVRVKEVERKAEALDNKAIEASAAVAIVCGADSTTADRYEARNDALRSIARRRDLPKNDVDALVKFLASANDPLPVGRVATLKNDVMNRSSAMRVPSAYTKLLHFVEMCISKTMRFVVITHFKNRAIFILGSCI